MTVSRTLKHQMDRRRRRRKWRKIGAASAVSLLLATVCLVSLYTLYTFGLIPDQESKGGGLSPELPGETDTPAGLQLPPEANDPETAEPSEQTENPEEEPIHSREPADRQREEILSDAASADESEARMEMAFVGDVLLGSTVETILRQHGFHYPYTEVSERLQRADLAVANFESPVTKRGKAQEYQLYVYRTSPEALPAFAEAGFDLVNLANNHVLDYGEEGLFDTLDYLDEAGIRRVGAGRDADEAYAPAMVEINGIKAAFLGFNRFVPDASWKAGKNHPGVAETYSDRRPLEEIRKAKDEADLVIVLVHWGVERSDKPENYQIQLAHRYIDAGADLVVGSHPHVLQGLEQYKGKWIAYSLGNFIFTTNHVASTRETVILEASCNKTGDCGLKVTPVFTEYAKPEMMTGDKAAHLLARLQDLSFSVSIAGDGTVRPEQAATASP